MEPLCHEHHVPWLSRGGADILTNMVLVCLNHHAAIHRCDAPLDYADLAFVFARQRERVQLDPHLAAGECH
jgi:5-methylcytosine-specific restriction protein A